MGKDELRQATLSLDSSFWLEIVSYLELFLYAIFFALKPSEMSLNGNILNVVMLPQRHIDTDPAGGFLVNCSKWDS